MGKRKRGRKRRANCHYLNKDKSLVYETGPKRILTTNEMTEMIGGDNADN